MTYEKNDVAYITGDNVMFVVYRLLLVLVCIL